MPHPVYGTLHCLAVVNPGLKRTGAVEELLTAAHHLARERFIRRADHEARSRADAPMRAAYAK